MNETETVIPEPAIPTQVSGLRSQVSPSEQEEIEQLLNPPDPNANAKLAALIAPAGADIGQFKFYAFNAGRLTLLVLAGIEKKLNAAISALNGWLDTQHRKLPDMTDREAAEALLAADPSACYHLAAIAFVCTRTAEELNPFRADPATLEKAVFVWMDSLADETLWLLNFRSLAIYFESKLGEDFTVASEGKPPDPNASTRAGSRSTAPPSASTGSPKTGRKPSGAKRPSTSAGSITTPPSPCPVPAPSAAASKPGRLT